MQCVLQEVSPPVLALNDLHMILVIVISLGSLLCGSNFQDAMVRVAAWFVVSITYGLMRKVVLKL